MSSREGDDGTKPFLARLALRNYKSIAACDVHLRPFTALVGPNGAGKSNVLDSLRFVADALRNSLEFALRDRGGVQEVRRRSGGHPTHFGIRLEMALPNGSEGCYAFQIAAREDGGFAVQQEECSVWKPGEQGQHVAHYRAQTGQVVASSRELPAAIEPDRLYLGVISGLPEFRPVYDAVTRMGFYNLSPAKLRELQDPDPAEILVRDGGNIASVLKRLGDSNVQERVEQYLAAIVDGLRGVEVKPFGPKETVEFRQDVAGSKHPWRFLAASMSDGTLRALGILVAVFQGRAAAQAVPLVGIEEPEIALHPAAARTIADAILEASQQTQVVITSHSPDLLDHEEIASESVLAVVSRKGETIVGPIDNGSRQMLREGLYTPGELLRLEQLEPEGEPPRQLALFGGAEHS